MELPGKEMANDSNNGQWTMDSVLLHKQRGSSPAETHINKQQTGQKFQPNIKNISFPKFQTFFIVVQDIFGRSGGLEKQAVVYSFSLVECKKKGITRT